MAYSAQGTLFFWCTSTAKSTSTSGLVGEVIDFSGPGGQANVIDVTHLNSTAKEKLMGIRDEGQLTLTLNHAPADPGHLLLQADRAARTKKACVIKFSDPASYLAMFDGYCLGYSISGGVDDKVTANVVIEIADAVTYSTTMS